MALVGALAKSKSHTLYVIFTLPFTFFYIFAVKVKSEAGKRGKFFHSNKVFFNYLINTRV